MNYLLHHSILLALTILVIYGSVALAYLYMIICKNNWLSKILRCRAYETTLEVEDLETIYGFLWPLTLIVVPVYWLVWLMDAYLNTIRMLLKRDLEASY